MLSQRELRQLDNLKRLNRFVGSTKDLTSSYHLIAKATSIKDTNGDNSTLNYSAEIYADDVPRSYGVWVGWNKDTSYNRTKIDDVLENIIFQLKERFDGLDLLTDKSILLS